MRARAGSGGARLVYGLGQESPSESCAAGPGRIYISVAALIDTNILVYRYDWRFPEKQKIATELLREGLIRNSIRIPHQALLEFIAVVTRVRAGGAKTPERPLLDQQEARREAEELLLAFPILYPDAALFRAALRGAAAYQLSWFEAHLWAYAEHYGMDELLSEDFEHKRLYGSVRARNPFLV
jgi:predicted nucleic acid-binding protein